MALSKLREQEKRRLGKLRAEAKRKLSEALSIEANLIKLRGISDEEWQAAVEVSPELVEVAEKARDWQSVVAQMTQVQALVHLAMRWTVDNEEQIRSELLRQRRAYYEAELTAQAARAGCPNRKGLLREGPELTELNEQSKADAASIVNTYNYDVAQAILNIAAEVPTANRWVYAKRLESWEADRATWKDAQIAQFTEGTARSKAQSDFYKYNRNVIGTARLEPRTAVCPVCQGWIDRGEVPLHVATANPGPYHLGCPHTWDTNPEKVAKSECPELWMG